MPAQRLLLYLCVHGALDGWLRLKWLADIAALLRTMDAQQLRSTAALAALLFLFVRAVESFEVPTLLGLPVGIRDTPLGAVSLVTRDDEGNLANVELGLEELVGEGASIIIAGLDVRSAEKARAWGEREKVPVVLLSLPEDVPGAAASRKRSSLFTTRKRSR